MIFILLPIILTPRDSTIARWFVNLAAELVELVQTAPEVR